MGAWIFDSSEIVELCTPSFKPIAEPKTHFDVATIGSDQSHAFGIRARVDGFDACLVADLIDGFDHVRTRCLWIVQHGGDVSRRVAVDVDHASDHRRIVHRLAGDHVFVHLGIHAGAGHRGLIRRHDVGDARHTGRTR